MNLDTIRHALNRFRGFLRKRREKRLLPDDYWRETCQSYDVPIDSVKLRPDGSLTVTLTKSSVDLPRCAAARSILSGYVLMRELESDPACSMHWEDSSEGLVVSWGKTSVIAHRLEHVHTLHEVNVKKDYNLASYGPCILIDVGANVGFTSIFLAEHNTEMNVIGCEPVPECYEQAVSNVRRNLHLSNRIALHNYGLASEDAEKVIFSDPEHRVKSSFIIPHGQHGSSYAAGVPASTRCASDFLEEIAQSNPGRKIILKVDCEGGEYEILENLQISGAIGKVSGILLEWHSLDETRNSSFIRAFCLRNGFDVVMPEIYGFRHLWGMAYAFRTT